MVVAKTSAQGAVVPVRLSGELLQKVDRTAELLRSSSRNELIREAIERYVDEVANSKVVEVRDISIGDAARLIEEYVSRHPGVHHVSELAEALGIELGVAFGAVQGLVRDEKVRVKK